MVSAINIVGESVASEITTLLAAEVPDPPAAPTLVSQSPTTIVISWVAPHDRGTPIRDY